MSDSYVPTDMFPEWTGLDDFERKWYSKHVEAAGEPPISLPTKVKVYRFIWLRSFHNPIIVRIECSKDCFVTSKVLSGAGGYGPGEPTTELTRMLTPSERDRLAELFSAVGFWDGPSEDDSIGVDGARWILEAAASGSYNAWSLWSPVGEPLFETFVAFCDYMVAVGGISISSDELY